MKVSAVVVSRMDHPLGEVLDSILPHVEELIVVRGHDGVRERWEAAARASGDVLYTQDDDAVVNVGAILGQFFPGAVVCNMPPDHRKDYPDGIALVGWGCVCQKKNIDQAFSEYYRRAWADMWEECGSDAIFRRECDRVFTGLSPLKLIDVPVRHLPQAHGNDRMGREARHGADLQEIRRRIYAIRNGRI